MIDSLAIYSYSKKVEVPTYSFAKHQRQEETTAIYSPHVLILEGIFALYDPRVLDLLDMKVCHWSLRRVPP
jgi:uridine kinase